MNIPEYLKDYENLYAQDPRKAALEWFKSARYGLFMHYGLYSLTGVNEWVQYQEKIPVREYERLANDFTAENFDAEAIANFAEACGMRYINITTRHHDSFCLFNTKETDFNSVRVCGRDLVEELAEACRKRGLGLCLYYSHGRDWRHPHAPNNDEWGGFARPLYPEPEPSYAYGDEHDLNIYLEFIKAQITELLTQYGPIAAIWLDGIAVPMSGDYTKFKCQELYDHIHNLQPNVLISYKQGLIGTEDFFAPEHKIPSEQDNARVRGKISDISDRVIEVCTSMMQGSWGYSEKLNGKHLSETEVWEKLMEARTLGYNLLLNVGPLPDGRIPSEDKEVLLKVGERLSNENV